MDLVSTTDELKENLFTFEMYGNSPSSFEMYKAYLKRGACFVIFKLNNNTCLFGPSRFLGYKSNTFEKHESGEFIDGRDTNHRISYILNQKYEFDQELEETFLEHCNSLGFEPHNKERKYWLIEDTEATETLYQTEVLSEIKTRRGQSLFRQRLLDYWNGCSVTGIKDKTFLIASHIKPWSLSDQDEKLDVYNGLLLIPNLDRAFDRGYISFNDDGQILINGDLSSDQCNVLGIKQNMKVFIQDEHKKYLADHRRRHGF